MARGLAAAGAHVLINGRDPAVLESIADQLRQEGLRADAIAFDVADHEASAAALAGVADRGLMLDVLVNNVGHRDRRSYADMTPEDLTGMLQTNLVSAF